MDLPPTGERKRLVALLTDLAGSLEDLGNTGLATASRASLAKIEVAFKETSGRRLLRLGSTLRILSEEMRRYLNDDERFSKRRFGLFATRGWVLARRMAHVVDAGDEEEWRQLTRTAAPRPLPDVVVLALGVAKNVAEGMFCGFDFRFRVLEAEKARSGQVEIKPGDALMWTAIYPMKDSKVAPESFLQLQQAQKFRPRFLLKEAARIQGAAAADGRLFLGPKTTVESSQESYDLGRFTSWDAEATRDRWQAAEPGPLVLDAERREEVVLEKWSISPPTSEPLADRHTWSLEADGVKMTAVAKKNLEGKELFAAIEKLRRLTERERPPLFGLLHYELCRLVFQPLSKLGGKYPEHLMISDTKLGARELLKSLDLNL